MLDFRVTVLEENGGCNGNSSVAELEVRVETLEGTAADHQTRISAAEDDINGNAVPDKFHRHRLHLVNNQELYHNYIIISRFGRSGL